VIGLGGIKGKLARETKSHFSESINTFPPPKKTKTKKKTNGNCTIFNQFYRAQFDASLVFLEI